MTKRLSSIPISTMEKIIIIDRAYMLLNAPSGFIQDPDFDKRMDEDIARNRRNPLEIGVGDIATEASLALSAGEATAFFSFFRDHFGQDLFDVISTPEEEASRILRRGKVRDYDEARLLDGYIEIFEDEAEHAENVARAQALLEKFEKENPSEP